MVFASIIRTLCSSGTAAEGADSLRACESHNRGNQPLYQPHKTVVLAPAFLLHPVRGSSLFSSSGSREFSRDCQGCPPYSYVSTVHYVPCRMRASIPDRFGSRKLRRLRL